MKNLISSEHYILAGNVAKVQDLIHGMDYIFLFGQLLCCATQTASLVHVTLHALPQPIRIHRILTVTNCTMAVHWCDTSWLQTRYSISIRLCDGLVLEYTDGTASGVANLLNIPTTVENTRKLRYFSN